MRRRRGGRRRVRNEASRPGLAVRWLARALGAAALLTGVALGVHGFEPLAAHWAPGALAMEELTVVGARRVPVGELEAALALPAGTPVLSPDRSELERRLESHPGVRRARVALVRPGRVVAEIEEREPSAVTHLGFPPVAWLVDVDGTPFAPAGAEDAYPAVAGPEDAEPDVADARLREGVRIARRLAGHGFGTDVVVEVAGAPPAQLPALRLGSGPRVLLGPGELDQKLARLRALLGADFPETRQADEIDLRFGDRLVLRGGPSAGADEEATAGGHPAPLGARSAG